MKKNLQDLCKEFSVREIVETGDFIKCLELRQTVYSEAFGMPAKPHNLDINPYDWRSCLFGVFHGDQVIATVRITGRSEVETSARCLAEIDAIYQQHDQSPAYWGESVHLPSEEIFRYPGKISAPRPEVEFGRLAVDKKYRGTDIFNLIYLTAIGGAWLDNTNVVLFSCPKKMLPLYLKYTPMMYSLMLAEDKDGFKDLKFIEESAAVVMDIGDTNPQFLNDAIFVASVARGEYQPKSKVEVPRI